MINMGSTGNDDWHHLIMSRTDADTYMYICNGAQHSSSFSMNHRYWFRASPPVPPAASCKDLLDGGGNRGNGQYEITPIAGEAAVTVECDMTRAGGGWTLGVKHWQSSGVEYSGASAYGSVDDALTLQGQPYKLSDAHIRAINGAEGRFDILFDQKGWNSAYAGGNYECVHGERTRHLALAVLLAGCVWCLCRIAEARGRARCPSASSIARPQVRGGARLHSGVDVGGPRTQVIDNDDDDLVSSVRRRGRAALQS